MLHRCVVARWVPRHVLQRVPKARPKERRDASAVQWGGRAAPRPPHDFQEVKKHDRRVRVETKEIVSMADPTVQTVAQSLVKKANVLLDRWEKLNETVATCKIGQHGSTDYSFLSNGIKEASLEQERALVSFIVRTEVLAVVKDMLPPSERQKESTNRREEENKSVSLPLKEECTSSPSLNHMVVVPDEATRDAEKYVEQIKSCYCNDKVGDKSYDLPGVFSLHEIVIFLQLYDALNCEDGELLLRLLEELRRIVFQQKTQEHNNDKLSGLSKIKEDAVIPHLLSVLSSLGIGEENVLQQIITIPGVFLSRAKIARYMESDLLRLLVSLHRFGLHHEPCFNITVKVLRHRSLRNPLKSFLSSAAVACKANAATAAVVSTSSRDAKKSSIPSCILGLTVNELLEGLTAMSLSLFRDKSVVDMLALTIAISVEEEQVEINNRSRSTNSKEKDDLGVFRTLQVHRAAKICEQMELPQLILADLLHRLSVRYGGLLADGGEDSSSPERVGFYDFITADLVKVRHM